MNIFFLSLSAQKAARMQCDKHVVKMILETAQLLCTAIHLLADEIPLGLLMKLYKCTHKNHPAAIWVRKSEHNFAWTLEHGLALCAEYTKRYGKVHKTQAVLESVRKYYKFCDLSFPQQGPTAKPICMPLQYRYKGPSLEQDVVDSYWLYYVEEKERFAKWTRGETPQRWKVEVGKKRKREIIV